MSLLRSISHTTRAPPALGQASRSLSTTRLFIRQANEHQQHTSNAAWLLLAAGVGAVGGTMAVEPIRKVTGTMTSSRVQEISQEKTTRRIAETWVDEELLSKMLSSGQATTKADAVYIRLNSTPDSRVDLVLTETEQQLVCGEPVLLSFTVHNTTSEPIQGAASYSVHPPEAEAHLRKIRCFCFEQQVIQPGESVDMPALVFLDPEFRKDLSTSDVKNITLNFTFS